VIHRRAHLATILPAALLTALLMIGSGCSSDDDAVDDGSTTTVATPSGSATTPIEFSTTVSDEWGPLADCPIAPQSSDPSGAPADDGVDGVLEFGDQARDHVTECVDYTVNPAVGGKHFPQWANCGFYTSPVPEEFAVHVLEHGGVWIAFDPTIGADDVAAIRDATDAATHVLANPYPGLTSKIVLSAWSRQLDLDSTSDPRFQAFIDTYVQGPNTPELGAPCSGGIGTPKPSAATK